jgi:nitrite reductase (NO-forming)
MLIGSAVAGPLVPAAFAAAPAAAATKAQVRTYILSTGMADGKMVFLDTKGGTVNPTLRANVGDTIEITIASGEGAQHDIVFPELKVHSKHFDASTGPTKVRFKVNKAGTFKFICSVPGHQAIGMEGVLEVAAGPKTAAVEVPAEAVKTVAARATAKSPAPVAAAGPAPAAIDAVSISMDPNAVPKPLGNRPPQLVKYEIQTVELAGKLDDGTTFTYWTFDKKVPGPMLRVKQGDTVELTLSNAKNSKAIHSIDLHSVTGGHGGGEHTQVAPGQSKTVRFKVLNPGLYVYHCATASVPHHISAGMYGLILVEPPEGLAPVDKEFYVMQGDLYTKHAAGTRGHHEYSPERASDELPTFYTFNGSVGALTKEHKMTAKVGETVRVYFGVGGPNKVSSFHVIGEIFDKVYSEGSLTTVKNNVQTTLVAPGGATMVDFKVNYPGKYLLVDHALSRVGKGLAGALEVQGEADASVYQPLGNHAASH